MDAVFRQAGFDHPIARAAGASNAARALIGFAVHTDGFARWRAVAEPPIEGVSESIRKVDGVRKRNFGKTSPTRSGRLVLGA